MRRPRPAALAAVAATLVLLSHLVVVLLREDVHSAGSNAVRIVQPVATLEGGAAACQSAELVPRDAASVEVWASTAGRPGPPLVAELRDAGGRPLASGRVQGGYFDGFVAVPIGTVRRTIAEAEVCLRADGPGTASIHGVLNREGKLQVAGDPVAGAYRIAYLRPGRDSWLALAPTLAQRFAVAKTTLAGPWLFWVVLAVVLAVAVLGLRTALSSEGEPSR